MADNIAFVLNKENVKEQDNKLKHIFCENLYGNIIIHYIERINTFILKYEGQQTILLDGKNLISGRSYIIKIGSVISGPNIRSIYFKRNCF